MGREREAVKKGTMFNFPLDYFTYLVQEGCHGRGGRERETRDQRGDALVIMMCAIEFKEIWLIEKAEMLSDRHQ